MIYKVLEDNSVATVSIASHLTETEYVEKYGAGQHLIIKDIPVVGQFLKFNGTDIVEDLDKANFYVIENVKNNVRGILGQTDFLLLIDNPKSLTQSQIDELISYRSSLRASTVELPLEPTWLSTVLA